MKRFVVEIRGAERYIRIERNFSGRGRAQALATRIALPGERVKVSAV